MRWRSASGTGHSTTVRPSRSAASFTSKGSEGNQYAASNRAAFST